MQDADSVLTLQTRLLKGIKASALVLPFILSACGLSDSSDGASTDGIVGDQHRIFITSSTYTGNLGGISGADSKCQTAAQNAGLLRTYKAIISDSSDEARDNLSLVGEVLNIDSSGNQDTIVEFGANLWDSSLDTNIKYDEFGNFQSGRVWTGTDSDGGNTSGTLENCSNWSSSSSGVDGGVGDSTSSFGDWVEDASTQTCDNSFRLYCISQ